ncbi:MULTISPECIES: sensor histidine kinase [unclassified Streptomyces]|uniref:sensor histidine kinase n=1 Tax=unclassified Streptomyces TaxID=2593676 RepID=UPI0006AE4C72|nr:MULTISPECIES: histidine kinase [unclassified Streptomyces]KOX22466.1 histidine kinase [Streptomyces sp. NRRL F-6491]KOX38769.1 histidine kinase [Streptomyces sp. NRRL F-6492]
MTRTDRQRWLLPSHLVEPGGSGAARPRRTVRDWIVDTSLFLLAALVGLVAADTSAQYTSETVTLLDQLAGAAACCALWLRRRWPAGLAIGLSLVNLVAPVAAGAVLASLFSVAVRRPFREVAPIGALAVATSTAQAFLRPDPTTGLTLSLVLGFVLILLVTAWGMLVRSRRQLVEALRERARRAEAEAELRAAQAQRLAREAIAREMHDVLAHRLTLLSVHAGALEFRPDAPPEQIARAAGVIRDSAHEALQDLREIIGVLRAPDEDGEGNRPQPTLATLGALVEESRGAGAEVVLDTTVDDPAAVPAATGRTVYRIAQEGLTNARKHAPGTPVTVTVRGRPGEGLTVDVHNPAPAGPVPHVPGSGQGLIGLTERAALAGGRLAHGPAPDGGFALHAWLPWPP